MTEDQQIMEWALADWPHQRKAWLGGHQDMPVPKVVREAWLNRHFCSVAVAKVVAEAIRARVVAGKVLVQPEAEG